MKYISLDIETTSLYPCSSNVLELAMVLEDSSNKQPLHSLRTFHAYVYKKEIEGQPYALFMNSEILKLIATVKKEDQARLENGEAVPAPNGAQIISEACIWEKLEEWLTHIRDVYNHGKRLVLAGKNVRAFDYLFLPQWIQEYFIHRSIDVGSLYLDWSKDAPPSMKDILGQEPKHTALEDAHAVIKMLRNTYGSTPHAYQE